MARRSTPTAPTPMYAIEGLGVIIELIEVSGNGCGRAADSVEAAVTARKNSGDNAAIAIWYDLLGDSFPKLDAKAAFK